MQGAASGQDGSGQGYVTLATGAARYLEMATNLAASIKVMDPGRPVCLITDPRQVITPAARALFDHIVVQEPDPDYASVLEKMRVYDASPYAHSMFVDADCLLVKRDIEFYWDATAGQDFAITGERRTHGEWKGIRIEEVIAQEGAPYVVQMNSGVFAWRRGPAAKDFFDGLRAYYLARKHVLGIALIRGRAGQTHELYLGLYMGLRGMSPLHGAPAPGASWMVSTWRALSCSVDVARGTCAIVKPTGFLFGIPLLPTGFRLLRPSFAHFIGLKPAGAYRRAAAAFRERALQDPAVRGRLAA